MEKSVTTVSVNSGKDVTAGVVDTVCAPCVANIVMNYFEKFNCRYWDS
jgi:hypothetical protein